VSNKKKFRKQFWKQKRTIGSIVPSSRFLTKKVLQNIDFKNDKIIVELGPGTGVFTHEIIQNMASDCVLIVFEVNDVFFHNLSEEIDDQRVHLIHDSATKINQHLKDLNIRRPDVIISSLPLSAFPSTLRQSILYSTYNTLNAGGKFIQFQYSLQMKTFLQKLYIQVQLSFALFNVPPAFIYCCRK